MNWNIRKIVLYLTVVVVICFVVGLSIIVSAGGFTNNRSHVSFINFDGNYKTFDIKQDKKLPIEGISDLIASMPVGTINLLPEKRNDIEVNLYGSVEAKDDYKVPELECSTIGGKITIEVRNKEYSMNIRNSKIILDIHIPSDYSKNINLKTVTGDMNISNMALTNIDCKVTTGNININNIKAEILNTSCITGDIDATNITCQSSTLDVITGSIKFHKFTGELNGKIVTGDIYAEISKLTGDINLSSTTGSLRLQLPEDAGFSIKAKANIGDVSCSFPVNSNRSLTAKEVDGTIGSGKYNVILNITTGDIKVD